MEAYDAEVIIASDYYPFGLQMGGRTHDSPNYKYGFNGMEKDDEIYGYGNLYTAEFWTYDPRIGRRWNIDPVTVPSESPYAAFRNNPIFLNDPNGDCSDCPKPDKKGKREGVSQTTTHTYRYSDPMNMGMTRSEVSTKKWYWHSGSGATTNENGDEITPGYTADWYSASDYKRILTGSSWGATEIVPLNVKLALGDFAGLDEGEITGKDLTTEQLVALRTIALSNFAKGKMQIDYVDYKTHSGNNPYSDVTSLAAPTVGTSNSDRWSKINNPNYILKTSLGAATLVVEGGKLYVVDQYNFNDAHATRAGKTRLEIVQEWSAGAKEAGSNVYKQFRNAGTYFGSEEGKGDKVKILIKKF